MSLRSKLATAALATTTTLGFGVNNSATAQQTAAPQIPAYAQQFSDTALAERNAYYNSVKAEISFDPNAFSPSVRTLYSATFELMKEKGFGRTDWVTKTDTGWVSNGGADPYLQYLDFMKHAPVRYIEGREVRGPYRLLPDAQTDLANAANRFEAKFGPHVLAFKSEENAKKFQELVLKGEFLALQNFQCAQAPVAAKNATGLNNQHLATSANPIWASMGYTANPGDGGVEYPGTPKVSNVISSNAGHVGMAYQNWTCAAQSNQAFWQLRTAANTSFDAASKLAAANLVYNMEGPAVTAPAATKNLDCAGLTNDQLQLMGFNLN